MHKDKNSMLVLGLTDEDKAVNNRPMTVGMCQEKVKSCPGSNTLPLSLLITVIVAVLVVPLGVFAFQYTTVDTAKVTSIEAKMLADSANKKADELTTTDATVKTTAVEAKFIADTANKKADDLNASFNTTIKDIQSQLSVININTAIMNTKLNTILDTVKQKDKTSNSLFSKSDTKVSID